MVELGCNYSESLMQLLKEEIVNVDWIKLSRGDVFWEEHAIARPVKPILLHILPNAEQLNLDKINWDEGQLDG